MIQARPNFRIISNLSVPISRPVTGKWRRNLHSNAVKDNLDTKADPDPRWLSDVKARIGKCITFGLSAEQLQQAGGILQRVARDWRELSAGSEGFLTDKNHCGLHQHSVVWGEMDSMTQGHVNNVQYVRYAETGRCNWIRNFGVHIDPKNKKQWFDTLSSRGVGFILKSIKVDYKFPMTWPDQISVYHKLRSMPSETSSILILDVLIMSEARQRPAARCLEEVVTYDYQAGKKTALPPFMLKQFQETFTLQEETKEMNRKRLRQILDDVRQLEKSSWDRPDAQEDFGSASP